MRNLKNYSCFLFTVVLLTVITACSIRGPAQRTVKQIFVLRGSPASSEHLTAADHSGCSLRVSTPASAGGLNTARMAYSTEPNQLEYFAYHEWAVPPAKMVAELMETRLDATGLFRFVISGSPGIKSDLRLDSHLQTLQQYFRGDTSSVNLTLKVSLVEVETRSLIDSRTFSYRETAERANAEAGVAAANLAVERFIIDLSEFLESSLTKVICSDAY